MVRTTLISAMIFSLFAFGCSQQDKPTTNSSGGEFISIDLPSDLIPDSGIVRPLGAPPPFLTDYYDAYNVKIVWGGPLGLPGSNLSLIDWTGRLELSGAGEMALSQTISFDPGQDSIYLTNAVHLIAWASTTGIDFDGIEAIVYLDRRVMSPTRGTISFQTGPVTFSIVADRLVAFDTLILVNNSSGVVMSARQITEQCASGAVAGDWTFSDKNNGSFDGVWSGPSANTGGKMQGRFTTSSAGSRALSGFWLDNEDSVIGLLTGSWGYLPSAISTSSQSNGYFAASIHASNVATIGAVAGVFGSNAPVAASKTSFSGRWYFGSDCRNASVAEVEH